MLNLLGHRRKTVSRVALVGLGWTKEYFSFCMVFILPHSIGGLTSPWFS